MDWLKEIYIDHGAVEGINGLLMACSKDLAKGEESARLDDVLELAHAFTELCHHAKEEKVLFPVLRSQSDIQVCRLLNEHDLGKKLIRKIKEGEKDEKIRNIVTYDALLKAHIGKENRFFKECGQKLASAEQRALSEGFARIDADTLGPGGMDSILGRITGLKAGMGR
ncbi:hemerythrin domain-containing protein [Candidatus Micrarchaeota archaeon]|nr:hemerythrin domain-containing protein [Candidatus Micrarchaeota archaeon]